jgi:GDP-D-mannose dehydratase
MSLWRGSRLGFWGWAEDYVEAMYLMLQQEESDDDVIATGESYQLALLIEIAFGLVGLGWVAKHQIADMIDLRSVESPKASLVGKLGIGMYRMIARLVDLV